jgi:predicted SprT family Zn-dependent metalloprotease
MTDKISLNKRFPANIVCTGCNQVLATITKNTLDFEAKFVCVRCRNKIPKAPLKLVKS